MHIISKSLLFLPNKALDRGQKYAAYLEVEHVVHLRWTAAGEELAFFALNSPKHYTGKWSAMREDSR